MKDGLVLVFQPPHLDFECVDAGRRGSLGRRVLGGGGGPALNQQVGDRLVAGLLLQLQDFPGQRRVAVVAGPFCGATLRCRTAPVDMLRLEFGDA